MRSVGLLGALGRPRDGLVEHAAETAALHGREGAAGSRLGTPAQPVSAQQLVPALSERAARFGPGGRVGVAAAVGGEVLQEPVQLPNLITDAKLLEGEHIGRILAGRGCAALEDLLYRPHQVAHERAVQGGLHREADARHERGGHTERAAAVHVPDGGDAALLAGERGGVIFLAVELAGTQGHGVERSHVAPEGFLVVVDGVLEHCHQRVTTVVKKIFVEFVVGPNLRLCRVAYLEGGAAARHGLAVETAVEPVLGVLDEAEHPAGLKLPFAGVHCGARCDVR